MSRVVFVDFEPTVIDEVRILTDVAVVLDNCRRSLEMAGRLRLDGWAAAARLQLCFFRNTTSLVNVCPYGTATGEAGAAGVGPSMGTDGACVV